MNADLPPTAPQAPLLPIARSVCEVGTAVQPGGPGRHGERRFAPILRGRVSGAELNGEWLEGGADWQVQRAGGVTEISARCIIRRPDGALVEVQGEGPRHGTPVGMARLARGGLVGPQDHLFRARVRLTTGHRDWLQLDKITALAVGQCEARQVRLDLWRIG